MLTKVYRNGKKNKVTIQVPFLTLIIIWVLLVFTFVSGTYRVDFAETTKLNL